jgi:hypothetical protein
MAGVVMLCAAALGQSSTAATKPADGTCECGRYIEAPALCHTLPADKREACHKSNADWFDQCVAWQDASCTSGVTGAVAKPLRLDGPRSLIPKYAGTWKGRTICPKQGTWDVMLWIRPQPDGSYLAKAATEGVGEFKKLTFQDNGEIALLYSSVFKDSSYTGHLATPDRLQGHVKIQEDCTWFMSKSP